MHLLDTDTLSHWYRGNPRVLDRLREHGSEAIGITIVSKVEILRGRYDAVLKAADAPEFLRAQAFLFKTEEFLTKLVIVPLDEAAVEHFKRLRAVRGLKKLGRADLLIAAIALAHRATLVTRNVRDFQRVPNLIVANWVD